MRNIYAWVVLLLLFANNAFGQNSRYDKGLMAFDAKEYKTAFELLKPYAENGNCLAQFVIGYSYQYGRAVAVDTALAIHWLEMSAEQKQPSAMGPLAVALFGRHDATKDDMAKAYLWAMLAAEYLESQKYTSARYVIKSYLKEPDLAKANNLIKAYKTKWKDTANCH